VLTDDQKARKLAHSVLDSNRVQTTPHLFGWLCFISALTEAQRAQIIADHESHHRPLKPYLEEAEAEAVRCQGLSGKTVGTTESTTKTFPER